MSPMPAALERLRFAVRTLPGVLAEFSEAESERRPAAERWSKKEVIGHLIDSASNNHQRFVRGQLAAGQDLPGYEQERWVRVQDYQAARWHDLIDLWRAYNTHLLHVAEHMSEEGRRAICRVGGRAEVTLAGLFVDYVDHLEHHLRAMLGRWESGSTGAGQAPPLQETSIRDVTVRECRCEEAGAVLELWRQADATPGVTDTAEDLRRAIGDSPAVVLVAEVRGRLVGSIIGTFDGWRGNVYRLAVHPDRRRQGVARALVAEVEKRLARQGVKRVTALVEKEHPWAMAFWQAVGYPVDERIARRVRNL